MVKFTICDFVAKYAQHQRRWLLVNTSRGTITHTSGIMIGYFFTLRLFVERTVSRAKWMILLSHHFNEPGLLKGRDETRYSRYSQTGAISKSYSDRSPQWIRACCFIVPFLSFCDLRQDLQGYTRIFDVYHLHQLSNFYVVHHTGTCLVTQLLVGQV